MLSSTAADCNGEKSRTPSRVLCGWMDGRVGETWVRQETGNCQQRDGQGQRAGISTSSCPWLFIAVFSRMCLASSSSRYVFFLPLHHLLSLLPEQPLSPSPQPCIRSSSISLCSGCFALDGKPEVLSHTTSRMLSFQPFNAEQSGDQWIGEWQSRSSRHCEPLDRVSPLTSPSRSSHNLPYPTPTT